MRLVTSDTSELAIQEESELTSASESSAWQQSICTSTSSSTDAGSLDVIDPSVTAPLSNITTRLVPSEPEISVSPAISVVIPTRNEAGNVAELIRRLEVAAERCSLEAIFVDDSTDETPAVISDIARHSKFPILLRHRLPEERVGGLGGAVTLGITLARAPWVCVMDADLQHPPELIPKLLDEATRSESDVVIASRYCDFGGLGDFGRIRTYVSEGSTILARLAFPNALAGVTDPMSGFFLIRRDAIDLRGLQPRGFKILFEILCRTPGLRKTEVPFRFGERFAGESKASLQEGVRYVRQLLDLRFGPSWVSFVRFGMVGLTGIAVNAIALAAFTEMLGLFYLISAVAATQVSTLWNFVLTELVVFDRTFGSIGRLRRAGLFYAMNNAALGLRGPMLFVLVGTLGVHYMISNLISLASLLILRFVTADRLIWRRPVPVALESMSPVEDALVPFTGSSLVSTETVH
jgi:dolichol-phosphate mannosyltransferase